MPDKSINKGNNGREINAEDIKNHRRSDFYWGFVQDVEALRGQIKDCEHRAKERKFDEVDKLLDEKYDSLYAMDIKDITHVNGVSIRDLKNAPSIEEDELLIVEALNDEARKKQDSIPTVLFEDITNPELCDMVGTDAKSNRKEKKQRT
jgi:hypothetical protein